MQNAFYGMASVLGTIGLTTLRQLNASVNELNIKIAVIISQVQNHDIRITNLEKKDD